MGRPQATRGRSQYGNATAPVQQFNHEFRETLQDARDTYKPPTALGVPLNASPLTKTLVSRYDSSPPCGTVRIRCRGGSSSWKLNYPTRVSDGPSGKTTQHRRRPHGDRIGSKGMQLSESSGLIHTPDHDFRKIQEARESVDKSLSNLRNSQP